jgi:hypothetical protein
MAALNPVNPGTFQIQVQAAFQGQTAAAAITQTNVMTAAQAASATTAGAGGAGAGGGGGGISGLAIGGIVGGVAVAGAAVVATGALGGEEAAIDPAVSAASGTYTLVQINGAGLPGLTVLSPPNSCAGFTDSGTMTLTAKPQAYDLKEQSHIQCTSGPGSSFNSGVVGTWTLQGGTITFSAPATGTFNPGPGTLSGSTLSFAFDAPHSEAGKPAFRVTSTWTK